MPSWNGVEFTSTGPKIRKAKLRQNEAKLGIDFPADYAEFLLAVNGGVPPKVDIPLCSSDQQVSVDLLFSVSEKPIRASLLAEQKSILDRTDGDLPDGFLVIGMDPGAAPFFLSTRGETVGNVYLFDPDGFLDKDRVRRLHQVSTSFTDLIDRIRQSTLTGI
jgi:hypothetical protein